MGSAGLLDDASLIQRIFDHIDRSTTDLADSVWHEPVANYRSEGRLTAEIHQVLRRYPTPFCPSAALAEIGSYVARAAAGVPLVAVRGHDGVVRAFRNACRHRGTALVAGRGCEKSLVCPYHGWVYRLDGALRHVPHAHGFPDLDMATHGLVGVRTEEHGGLVFVTQEPPPPPDPPDPPTPPDPTAATPPDTLPEVVGDGQVLVASDEVPLETNWKVFLEGFLEGYHIKATHRDTFFPFGYDNLAIVETFGRNSRLTFPFRRIEAQRDRRPTERHIDGQVTFIYHLFPNVVVARLSHHTTMVVIEPLAVDRTNLVTYQLTNRGDGAEARSSAARDRDFVALGAIEDLSVASAVQGGLGSGANDTLTFGRFEGAITHFHRRLTELLSTAHDGGRATNAGPPGPPASPMVGAS